MKIRAVKIVDKTLPVISCQSGIAQIELLGNHSFSAQEIQTLFQMIAVQQVPLQCINLDAAQIVFAVPCSASDDIALLLAAAGHKVNTIGDCAEINVSGIQMEHATAIAAKILAALRMTGISILQLKTSHASVSVLIQQPDLISAKQAIQTALQFSDD